MTKQISYYSMHAYLSYLKQFRGRIILVFLSFLVANSLLAIIPLFIGKLVGSLAGSSPHIHEAWRYVWLLIFCDIGHDIVWRVSESLYLRFLINVSYDYESLLFKKVINRPYPYFVDKFTGKIASYITTMSQELREFTENAFWDYTSQLVNLVGLIVILTTVNWQTGLLFASNIIFMFIVGRYSIRNNTFYERLLTDTKSTKNGKIIDAIGNFVNIKSFQKEAIETETIAHEQAKTVTAARRSFVWSMFFWTSMSFFIRELIWPISIIFNVELYLHHSISLAGLTTFLSAVLLFSTSIWETIWYISQLNLKLARIEESYKYLFGPVNIMRELEETSTSNIPAFSSSLELHKLHFAYPDKTDMRVLHDITLNLKKGEKIGIVGKSGSGKTTITKLLLGYYPAEEGQLLLDSHPISTKDLARLISYVPQDTSLFHRSVADNIAYATDRQVTREEIITAAKQAHADEFISQISDGYEALVGERGVKLSAGQRQRIAIARAFLNDKPILVLDEATSALDSESEVLVQQALEALWKHKTVIAIAHRLSTLRHMDRIIVLDKGHVIEQGSHKQLLAVKGKYAKLWAHQSGGFLTDEEQVG